MKSLSAKTRPKTKLLGDAVVTTVAGSILEHAGNSLEVLAKVPGMISKNGNLEVIGRGTPNILYKWKEGD